MNAVKKNQKVVTKFSFPKAYLVNEKKTLYFFGIRNMQFGLNPVQTYLFSGRFMSGEYIKYLNMNFLVIWLVLESAAKGKHL